MEYFDNPIKTFEKWFIDAVNAKLTEPNSFTLATVGKDLRPAQRVVLLKTYGNDGFVFFTEKDTKKVKQILENSSVSAHFSWLKLERQVRIEGVAESVSNMEFLKILMRKKGLNADRWLSVESNVINARRVLEKKLDIIRFEVAKTKKLPSMWQIYKIIPEYFEFWQGCKDKLYESVEYFYQNSKWIAKFNG
jgi:pyridoxamine 5'-phosphate oxidase